MPRKTTGDGMKSTGTFSVVMTVSEGKQTWNRVFTGFETREAAHRAVRSMRNNTARRQADAYSDNYLSPNARYVFAVADVWAPEQVSRG